LPNRMRNKNFINLFIFYSLFLWLVSFGGSLLPVHFLAQGISLNQMIFGRLIIPLTVFVCLLIFKSFNSRAAWRIAAVAFFGYLLLSVKVYNLPQFYFVHILYGIAMFAFYLYYNIAHFKNTPTAKTGYSSALMFSLGSIIGIFAPLAAGYLFKADIRLLWIFSTVSFFAFFYFIGWQKNFHLFYSIKSALFEVKSTRYFFLLEGVWEAIPFGVIPIFTLFFIKTPIEYGAYLAYLAFVSVVANILLGWLTDRMQKRAVFIYPLTIVMGLATFLFIFAVKSILLWIILTGFLQFLLPLFWNISTAIMIDAKPNLELAMTGREFLLNIGRVSGLLLVYASFLIEKTPHNLFFILGAVMLFYPIVLLLNTKIRKKYNYL